MFVFIAQGGGFYGTAFLTTDKSFPLIKSRLSGANLDCHFDDPNRAGSIHFRPDTLVLVRPWDGNAQPDPVVLFDSGHAKQDLDALNQVQNLLK